MVTSGVSYRIDSRQSHIVMQVLVAVIVVLAAIVDVYLVIGIAIDIIFSVIM